MTNDSSFNGSFESHQKLILGINPEEVLINLQFHSLSHLYSNAILILHQILKVYNKQ
jgi:hypothetical protein